ncbi:MAG: DUF4175 family protein [Gemmatimonadales bacterium]
MSVFELIARERSRVAGLLRAGTWTRALAVLVAALTLGALLLGGSRWIELPRVVPFVVWVAAIGGAAYLVRRGGQTMGRVAASEAIADEVEREQQMRRGAVRGIVELSGDTSAFVARAAQRLGDTLGARGTSLAPELQRRLRRTALVAGASLVPVVLIATFVAARRPDGFRALAHPVDAWRGALLPRLQIVDAPTRALRGSTLSLTVRATGRSTVSLRRRTTGNAWVETALAVSNGTVTTELGPLDADLTLVASDGRAESDSVVVRVVDRPFVGDVAVRATYPAYLHRATEALPGDAPIRVPKGTELAIEGHASEALASIWLVQERDSIRLAPQERRFSGHFTPGASGSWTWSARGASAAIADVPPPLSIEVVPDSAPSAEILQPASDSLVLPTAKIEMQLVASDDHGLQSVTLKTWRVTRDGKPQPPNAQKLAGGGIPDWAGVVSLDLGTWPLDPGDAVHVQLVARDESPAGQEGTSRELILRVPATDEQRAAARAAGDTAAARAEAAAKAQAGLQQRTSDAARAAQTAAQAPGARPGDPMKYDAAEKAKSLAGEQKDMAARVQQLQQASKALEDRLRAAGALDTNLSAKLREAQKLLQEALTPEMLDALKKLDNSAQQLSGDQAKQSLQQLVDQQKKMREALEKSAEILKRAALEGSMQTLKDEATELAKAERARADSAKSRAQQPEEAQRLQQRTDQLAKDLEALKDRLKQENADPAAKKADEALRDAEQAKDALDGKPPATGAQGQQQKGQQNQQSGQAGGQQQAGQQGAQQSGQQGSQQGSQQGGKQGGQQQGAQQGNQQGQQGAQSANQAADAMERASQALGEGRKQQVDEWKQELTGELDQSLQEMLQLAREQDGLADKAKKNPTEPNLRGEESALQQGVEKASERLASQAKRSALVSPRSTRAMSDAEQKVAQAARDAGDPRTASQAPQSMTDAASALRETAAALARDRERAGASQSASGLPELLAQLQQLAQQQGSLNGQMQTLVQRAGAEKGGQGVSPDMQSSARSLAKAQRDVANQLDDVGDADASGRAAELAREARQLAQTLDQGAVDPTVLARQQRLFRRMLDAGQTLENDQKEESGKRESRPGDQNNPFLPPGTTAAGKEALKYRVPEWNELRGMSADERRLVIEYFRRLNGEKP